MQVTKQTLLEDFLVALWLRLHASTARVQVQSLVRILKDPICHKVQQKKKKKELGVGLLGNHLLHVQ